MTRPGVRLRALAARWCSPQMMERVIEPVLADLQLEYEDSRSRGRRWRSRWIWIASHVALIKAMVKHGSLSGLELLAGMSAEDRRTVMRTGVWVIGATVVATVAFSASPLVEEFSRGTPHIMKLGLFLIPQALPIALPIGLIVGVLQGMREGHIAPAPRVLILLLALGVSTVSFVLVGWIMPQSNQAFRETVAGISIPRGPTELTLGQLRQALTERMPADEARAARRRYNLPTLEFAYHVRWAVSATPCALSLFALVVASRLRRGRVLRWGVACTVVIGYWALFFAGHRWLDLDRALPVVIAWTPNVAVLIVTLAIAALVRPSPVRHTA